MTTFAIVGLCHYVVIGTQCDTNWVKYFFVTLDPLYVDRDAADVSTAADLPAVTTFRGSTFVFYFMVLGVAALSFHPDWWHGPAPPGRWAGCLPSCTRRPTCQAYRLERHSA